MTSFESLTQEEKDLYLFELLSDLHSALSRDEGTTVNSYLARIERVLGYKDLKEKEVANLKQTIDNHKKGEEIVKQFFASLNTSTITTTTI